MSERHRDDALRRRALEVLGGEGEETAIEALENGALEVEPSVTTWEGSAGTVHGHRVWAVMPAELVGRVAGSLMAQDALSWAIAAALGERAGEALYDLRYEAGDVAAPPVAGPYR